MRVRVEGWGRATSGQGEGDAGGRAGNGAGNRKAPAGEAKICAPKRGAPRASARSLKAGNEHSTRNAYGGRAMSQRSAGEEIPQIAGRVNDE